MDRMEQHHHPHSQRKDRIGTQTGRKSLHELLLPDNNDTDLTHRHAKVVLKFILYQIISSDLIWGDKVKL